MESSKVPTDDRQLSTSGRRGWIEILSEGFEGIGLFTFDHRWVVLSSSLALLGICIYYASGTRFDNSFTSYFISGDPDYQSYLDYRDEFGSEEISYLVYEAPDRPHGAWNIEIMGRIAGLTEALGGLPFVSEVTSLVNVEFMEGVEEGIEIYELLEDFPSSQEELLSIRDKVLRKPMIVGGLTDQAGRYGALIIEMEASSIDPIEEIRLDPAGGDGLLNLYPQATYLAIEAILAQPEYEGIVFHHVGDVPELNLQLPGQ